MILAYGHLSIKVIALTSNNGTTKDCEINILGSGEFVCVVELVYC